MKSKCFGVCVTALAMCCNLSLSTVSTLNRGKGGHYKLVQYIFKSNTCLHVTSTSIPILDKFLLNYIGPYMGPFKCYAMQWMVGVCVSAFPEKSITKLYVSTLLALARGWVGVTFPLFLGYKYSDNDPDPTGYCSHRVVESSTSYTFPVQIGGIFYIPWHRHQIERTDGF